MRIPMCMRITGQCKGYNDVGQCFLPVHMANINQPVQKLVSFLVVCSRDFCYHYAGEHSPQALCSYPS